MRRGTASLPLLISTTLRGLALEQTFVGTLGAFDRSSRLRAVNDSEDVSRCGT